MAVSFRGRMAGGGLWLSALIATTGVAAAAERIETVKFKPGSISATVSGKIKGYDGVKYLFEARAGQAISILFAPKNTACYFNVFAPGAAMAVHTGSINGNEFAANLTANGEYRAQVFLMRSAARRHETCRYSMTIEISGAGSAAKPPAPVKGAEELPMLRACVASAAKLYGVTQDKLRFKEEAAAAPSTNGFEMNGEADKGAEGRKQFKCLFGEDRVLKQVMPLNSDGA
ncbi:hypothetical protein K9U39_19405 [Rhodoblastus acidophilus]|uniref:DNA breaking-rejoining protein n=1 Tax=Candidatus Rhodoblastus alkanivorans TaxID=2954117 RepID=A0ABS9Z4B2_9HYPH|nr:hypothetical protein [Candidatus Rhodoblastus alkanivorans]MCI4677287.1 hypothetical protein [Candidatus Rhodoblastus alkanivorans]MCI4682022.1 hypothetical protein [Candidatus Rhodoblastus alkanivorans]MDI4643073.1 hypothetical protein [Rhodoblastus acidophilus]